MLKKELYFLGKEKSLNKAIIVLGLSRKKKCDLEGAILVNWLWISFELANLFLQNSLGAGEASLQFLNPLI